MSHVYIAVTNAYRSYSVTGSPIDLATKKPKVGPDGKPVIVTTTIAPGDSIMAGNYIHGGINTKGCWPLFRNFKWPEIKRDKLLSIFLNDSRGPTSGADIVKKLKKVGYDVPSNWTNPATHLRVNARWTPVWSIQTHMQSFVAASNVDEGANFDVVAIESSAPDTKTPFLTFVRQLQVLESTSRPPSVSATKVELDCFTQPSELLANGAQSVLSIGMDSPQELYFEQIDLVARRATRTRFAGLLNERSTWGLQVNSSESIALWRNGAPARRFGRTGDEFLMAATVADDGRVQRLLTAYPSANEFLVMPKGRPIAQVRVSDSEWQLVSDQPVASPCVFPWHPGP